MTPRHFVPRRGRAPHLERPQVAPEPPTRTSTKGSSSDESVDVSPVAVFRRSDNLCKKTAEGAERSPTPALAISASDAREDRTRHT